MKPILLIFITSFLFQHNWEEYIDYDGRFRVQAPGSFTEKVDTVETAVGKLVYHTFHLQSNSDEENNLFYMISYVDYPEGIIFADSSGLVEELFQTSMESASEAVLGEIMYSADIQLDGYPGKFWRIDYLDGEAVIKTKAFLVENRYYSIQTIAYRERNINLAADRFFDSFRLLK